MDQHPEVWLRPSQRKIKFDTTSPLDPAHCVIDVLRRSHLKYPSRLSAEVIINLAENGVTHAVFVKLLQDNLHDVYTSLTDWDDELAIPRLWSNIARLGGVMSARMAREFRGESRMRGLLYKDDDDDDDDDELNEALLYDKAVNDNSTAWWGDETSGCPSSLEETVMVLLDSGFSPWKCPVLATKLHEILKRALKSRVDRYKIVVEKSCEGFVIPGDNAIYIYLSHCLTHFYRSVRSS